MNIRCEKSILVNMINSTLHVISSKSTIPALEGILIEAGEELTMTGFDLEVGIRCKSSAEIIERGTIVINGRLLSDIIRRLPDNMVSIQSNEKLQVTIKSGVSVFNLIGLSAADYPELPQVQKERYTTLPNNLLKKIIQGTIFSASENDSRPIITGCLFKITDDELVVVALDSFRLALRKEHVERGESTKNLNFVVPAKALREVDRFLDESDDEISIYISRRNICFMLGDTVLTTRLLEGEFLNYQNAIPDTAAKTLRIRTSDLITGLERVSLITNEKLRNFVKCDFISDKLVLTCTTSIGQSYDECAFMPLEGGDLTIGFNSRYLLDSLRACREEEVLIELNTPTSPMLIKPVEGEAYLYMILPVRLK